MAKEYNIGDRLYLPVWVTEKETNIMMGPDKSTTITDTKFSYAYWHGKTGEGKVRYGEDGLLLTATEIAENIAGRRCAECYPTYDEVKARNAELEALLKEVMATRDEAIRQNDELRKENDNLKEWYEEANKTATEAAEANDELKAKIAELKAERDKFAKTAKDKADLANKACDERNDVQGDLETAKAIVDHLQEENTKLKQELKDAEASYNVVADTSIKRKNRATTMEEVIVALVEKIRRLEGDD